MASSYLKLLPQRPAGSKTVAELDKGVHEIGKKIIEEAGEVWLAAEHEGNAELAKRKSHNLSITYKF